MSLRTVDNPATGAPEIRAIVSLSLAGGRPYPGTNFGEHASLEELLGAPLHQQPWSLLGELLGKIEARGVVY